MRAQPPLPLTGAVLASGAKYEQLSTIHSFWWAVENGEMSVCEGEIGGVGGRGGGTEEGRVTQDCVLV